jgi:hypothetical protein
LNRTRPHIRGEHAPDIHRFAEQRAQVPRKSKSMRVKVNPSGSSGATGGEASRQ